MVVKEVALMNKERATVTVLSVKWSLGDQINSHLVGMCNGRSPGIRDNLQSVQSSRRPLRNQ